MNYFIYRNAFLFDLLSVVPFRFFFVPKIQAIKTSNNLQLLHLFKLFRLKKIFQLLETRYVNNIIKEYYKSKLKNKLKQLKKDGKTTADSREDHNNIMK